MRFRSVYAIVCFIAGLTLGCRHAPEFRQTAGSAWGTTYHITYRADADLSDTIAAVIGRIDASLSPFRENSLISRINRGDSSARADSLFADVFSISSRVNSLTGGAFDPTLGPLISLWGFGPGTAASDGPSGAQVDSALALVGLPACEILPDGTVRKKHPGTQFNFSAVAKGYGVDCIARALARAGVEDYMVEVGGEIAVKGKNPRGQDWIIQIDAPRQSDEIEHERLTLLSLTNLAVATSGNYRNYRTTSSGTVGHTISPVTGRPVSTSTLSATVVAPDCALADALATACMALPADSALAIVESLPRTEALIVEASDTAAYTLRSTPGFATFNVNARK